MPGELGQQGDQPLPDLQAALAGGKGGQGGLVIEGGEGQLGEGAVEVAQLRQCRQIWAGVKGRQGEQHVRQGLSRWQPVRDTRLQQGAEGAGGEVLVVLARRRVGQGQGGGIRRNEQQRSGEQIRVAPGQGVGTGLAADGGLIGFAAVVLVQVDAQGARSGQADRQAVVRRGQGSLVRTTATGAEQGGQQADDRGHSHGHGVSLEGPWPLSSLYRESQRRRRRRHRASGSSQSREKVPPPLLSEVSNRMMPSSGTGTVLPHWAPVRWLMLHPFRRP